MRTKKYRVVLTKEERQELEGITKRGKHTASKIRRANILLNLDETNGPVKQQSEIAAQLNTTTATIYTVSKQFVNEGLGAVLNRKVRKSPARQPIATGDVEARIIALACGKPPEGRSRWTLRLLEEKVVELQIVAAISDNTIGRLLKKHHLSLI
jgi:transposase